MPDVDLCLMSVSPLNFPMVWPFIKSELAAPAAHAAPPPENMVSALAAAFPDPVLVLDHSGIVIASNEAASMALEGDPAGKHMSASIRAPAMLEAVNAAVKQKASTQVAYEVRFPVPRHFEAYVSPVSGQNLVLVVLKDLTREQLIEQMRADFVANASHELRTPLASLSGFIETLLGAAREDPAAREKFLVLMRSQADRMKRLIDDLLSLSRIEMNAHLQPSGAVDLAQVARHVGDIMSGMSRAEDCEIRIDIAEALPVTGDWDELVQVVQNLIENALKYASGGKLIEVKGRREGRQAVLAVRDHGPGIPAEHIPRLTERFYRVSVQASRLRGGTGLGLAIVKHILNRHRGRLHIASDLGKGSTFTITLPINI